VRGVYASSLYFVILTDSDFSKANLAALLSNGPRLANFSPEPAKHFALLLQRNGGFP
jgi:hypothetical protein